MHSSHKLREGARPEIVRDSVGHTNVPECLRQEGLAARVSGIENLKT